jgi:hypothetical protein
VLGLEGDQEIEYFLLSLGQGHERDLRRSHSGGSYGEPSVTPT